jgi:hypothetical protein
MVHNAALLQHLPLRAVTGASQGKAWAAQLLFVDQLKCGICGHMKLTLVGQTAEKHALVRCYRRGSRTMA